jgi:hypothetical protein
VTSAGMVKPSKGLDFRLDSAGPRINPRCSSCLCIYRCKHLSSAAPCMQCSQCITPMAGCSSLTWPLMQAGFIPLQELKAGPGRSASSIIYCATASGDLCI